MHQRGPHYEAQERISSHTDMLMHKYSPLHALSRVLSGKMTPPDPRDPIDISRIDVCYIWFCFTAKVILY